MTSSKVMASSFTRCASCQLPLSKSRSIEAYSVVSLALSSFVVTPFSARSRSSCRSSTARETPKPMKRSRFIRLCFDHSDGQRGGSHLTHGGSAPVAMANGSLSCSVSFRSNLVLRQRFNGAATTPDPAPGPLPSASAALAESTLVACPPRSSSSESERSRDTIAWSIAKNPSAPPSPPSVALPSPSPCAWASSKRARSSLSNSHGRTTALIDAVALAMAARVDSSSTVSSLRPWLLWCFGAASFGLLVRPTPLLVFRRSTPAVEELPPIVEVEVDLGGTPSSSSSLLSTR
mmetsp:Transcript_41344/g.95468  ORF Transcript_41344/g.95468 Transcript_41344/m.95468 type:complete len:291 (+) Transcript_41344:2883-3755(+)